MPVASHDQTRLEIREIEGKAHAVFVRLDVGQPSRPSVQCFSRSHAIFLADILCKVTASVQRPDCLRNPYEPSDQAVLFLDAW